MKNKSPIQKLRGEDPPEELEKFSGRVKDGMKTAVESLGKLQVVD